MMQLFKRDSLQIDTHASPTVFAQPTDSTRPKIIPQDGSSELGSPAIISVLTADARGSPLSARPVVTATSDYASEDPASKTRSGFAPLGVAIGVVFAIVLTLGAYHYISRRNRPPKKEQKEQNVATQGGGTKAGEIRLDQL
ncbi:hypothetical protein EK21DRAFT_106712 [Setomelanomma holmii]|uniref:Uncharacterized protein n=1 Tax=Setomelanomma holmii TaxID=210430 RepID=A0A9P4HLR5_9PLEO|nr:hypothetical protein EK21DRAFT_106712 [Setomelanomma holmii]